MSLRMLLVLLGGAVLVAASAYESEIAAWRQNREARLKADCGWLSVAGLFWLHEGTNPFGRDQSNEIVLPDGPARGGSFELHGGKVTVKQNGESRVLAADSSTEFAKVGRLSLFVLKRGEKYAIRLKDPESQFRKEFHGITYFPAQEKYRVRAKFVSQPRRIPILNILGQTEDSECPGYAVFQLNGKEHRLYPIIEVPGDKQLFYIVRDQTTGKETYGGGRFFYSDMPHNGEVVLDFNKAYKPPCVFTPYATCPLPPKENHMATRIEAGEKTYGKH